MDQAFDFYQGLASEDFTPVEAIPPQRGHMVLTPAAVALIHRSSQRIVPAPTPAANPPKQQAPHGFAVGRGTID